jgi:hypothetical protein
LWSTHEEEEDDDDDDDDDDYEEKGIIVQNQRIEKPKTAEEMLKWPLKRESKIINYALQDNIKC